MKTSSFKSLFTLCLLVLAYPLFSQTENYTHKLSQSTATHTFWTCTPAQKVFTTTPIPQETEATIKVYAAQNEFEPFVVVVNPKNQGNYSISVGDFGNGISTQIYRVKYINVTQPSDNLGQIGLNPDPLFPIENNSSQNMNANENTTFWINVFVPQGTPMGNYHTSVIIDNQSIDVTLHVFGFAIPEQLHVKSQMNFSYQQMLERYGVTGTGDNYWLYIDKIKQFFIDHRLTPKNPLWSGGLTSSGGAPYIDYDCNGTLTDNDGIWGFEFPANKYLAGSGFNNGTGFPSCMIATFRTNDASIDQRPEQFCNLTRTTTDWVGGNTNSAYNQKWFQYITTVQNYLDNLGYLDKTYYYFANEPQDTEDYDAIAWYSTHLKKAAPNLKLMLSEEPKPEIFNNSNYPDAKIDIWLSVLHNYNPDLSHDRELNYNEETWIYFLHGTRPPFFNPITLDHQGIEGKFTGWFLWKYRVRGIAYYSLNDWSLNPWTDPLMNTNHNGDKFLLYPPSENNQNISYGATNHNFVSSIRFEMLRDGFEDYEYLYLLNNASQPQVKVSNRSDIEVDKIITSLTSYTRDSQFLYNIRRLIGLFLGGEIAEIPDIQPTTLHWRSQGEAGNYYINFQNVNDNPTANPLIINNNEYEKVGWNEYDEELGYGWYGDMANVKYAYIDQAPNELQKSIIYDDWGRQKTFEYDLPNGTYDVTVSVGWQGRTYSHHKIDIEGISFINDEATTPDNSYIVRTKKITITDYKLTMNMGIFDEYTMLNYIDIQADNTNTESADNQFVQTTNENIKNYPNPFSTETNIEFEILYDATITIEVYSILGERIEILCDQNFINGKQSIKWNTQHLSNGMYIIKLFANGLLLDSKRIIKI